MAQILCGLNYKVRTTSIIKSGTIELFTLILSISATIHQSPYYYVVTTSKIGQFFFENFNGRGKVVLEGDKVVMT